MNVPKQVILLSIWALMVLPSLAPAWEIQIDHDWSVVRPGGNYGVFQYRTGPGSFDAGTVVMLGPRHFTLPAPLFAVLVVCGLPVLGTLALFLRGVFSDSRATNQTSEPTAASTAAYDGAGRCASALPRRGPVSGGCGSACRSA